MGRLLLVCLLACAAAPAQAQILPRCRLMGSGGALELPPRERPVILHVFTPTSEPDLPVLDRLAELQEEQAFPFEQTYVAVTVHPREVYADLERRFPPLVYDVGGETLHFPYDLRGFCTVIVDPRGFVTRIGRPDQWGYMVRLWTSAESLQETLALAGSGGRAPSSPPGPAAGDPGASSQPVSTDPGEEAPSEPLSLWAWSAPFLCMGLLAMVLGGRWRSAARRRLRRVLDLQPGLRCAVCAEVLARDQALVACSTCYVVSHAACQRQAGGCQTIGCPGSNRHDRFAREGA